MTNTYYAPTYFVDRDRSALGSDRPGSCTLLVRTFESSGTKGTIKLSAWTFDGEDALGRHLIDHPELRELPAAADGDPDFVPDELASLARTWLRLQPDPRDDRGFNVCLCTYHRWKPVEWNDACPLHGKHGSLVVRGEENEAPASARKDER